MPPGVDRERAPPEAQSEPERRIGGRQRVDGLMLGVGRPPRDGHDDRVHRLVEPRRTKLGAAQQRLGVGDGGRAGEHPGGGDLVCEAVEERAARRAGEHVQHAAERRTGEPLRRGHVVRVAAVPAGQARVVELKRDTEHRNVASEAALDRERELPAGCTRGLEQGVRRCASCRRGVTGAHERGRSSVQDGLGGRDDHDEIGLEKLRARSGPLLPGLRAARASRPCSRARRRTVELPGLRRRQERLEARPPGPPLEASGEEERLAVSGDANSTSSSIRAPSASCRGSCSAAGKGSEG